MKRIIVSPKKEQREQLMPLLTEILKSMKNVEIKGKGSTVFVLEVNDIEEFKQSLPTEICDGCFIEKVTQFSLDV